MAQAMTQQIPDALMMSYVSGQLDHAFSVVVAAHIEMSTDSRASYEAHCAMGGVVMDNIDAVAVGDDLRDRVFAQLDKDPTVSQPAASARGVYPAPVMQALKSKAPKWRSLGFGVKQAILYSGEGGSLRLLHIPGGQAVPDHGHNGLELTLVLQGAFSDETGRFGRGDLEIGDADLEHTPIADVGEPCICLAATDAPLRFNSTIPRLLQPIFRI